MDRIIVTDMRGFLRSIISEPEWDYIASDDDSEFAEMDDIEPF